MRGPEPGAVRDYIVTELYTNGHWLADRAWDDRSGSKKIRMPRRLPIRPLLLAASLLPAMTSTGRTFPMGMTVDVSGSPQVTFTWSDSIPAASPLNIQRRLLGETGAATWQSLGQITNPAKTFTDTTVEPGNTYEYRLYISAGGYAASKMITAVATVDSPLEDERGGVILVVDSAVKDGLAADIRRLEMDLAGDGWFVKRIDFAPIGSGTHQDLKAAVKAVYDATPGINSLFLFGNLPFARSGLLAPDGHVPGTSGGSYRAHETDTYYADLDGVWTDVTANQSVPGNAEQDNVPGDGKFDQNHYPTALELRTGRVTFRNMVATRKWDMDHLRDYLHKNHAWRHGHRAVNPKAIGGDTQYQFIWHNWLNPMFGRENVSTSGFGALETESRVFGVGMDAIDLVVPTQAVFMTNFRSWKQHWARTDNLIMMNLAQPDWGLTSTWGGRPSSFLHSMAAGKPIGYGFLASQNDLKKASNQRDYYTVGSNSFDESGLAYVSYNLMGDPTLRMHPVKPPAQVSARRDGQDVELEWTPADGAEGYHVYRSSERLGPYTRVTPSPVTLPQLTDSTAPEGEVFYQIRAIHRTAAPTGTYLNQSQGTFARITADGTANHAPSAIARALSTKHNTPLWFRFEGADPDGDTLQPVILSHPARGQIRWREGQPFYISAKDFTGTERIVFAMSDGTAVSAPAEITINVNDRGNTLLAWTIPDGGGSNLPGTYQAPGIGASSLQLAGYGAINTWPNQDQMSFRYAPAAFSATHYLKWSLIPQAGGIIHPERVIFALAGPAGRAMGLELRVSTDGFATHHVVPLQHGGEMTGANVTRRNVGLIHFADLSGISALQGASTAIDFRLHVWRTGGSSSESMSIGKLTEAEGHADGIEDLAVTGTVALPHDADGNGLPDVWETAYAGRTGLDPSADESGAGIGNLAAYLTGYAKDQPGGLSQILRHRRVTAPEGTDIVIEYRRRKERGAAAIGVESSPDLREWQPFGGTEETIGQDGDFEWLRITLRTTGDAPRFVRMKATLPPR